MKHKYIGAPDGELVDGEKYFVDVHAYGGEYHVRVFERDDKMLRYKTARNYPSLRVFAKFWEDAGF